MVESSLRHCAKHAIGNCFARVDIKQFRSSNFCAGYDCDEHVGIMGMAIFLVKILSKTIGKSDRQ
jgi:hypothetical protein